MEAQLKLTSSLQPSPATNRIGRLWKWLVHPHASLSTEEDKLHARLVMIMLLATTFVGLLLWAALIVALPDGRDDVDTWIAFGIIMSVGGAYFVARSGHLKTAIMVLIGATYLLAVPTPFLPGSQVGLLAFAVIPILLTAMFFSRREIVIVALLVNIPVLALITVVDHISKSTYGLVEQFVIFASVVIAILVDHREHLETVRQAELQEINIQLRASEATLEKRVQERTRDLEVAADVSREVARHLDLENLLPYIVERTAEAFDLYHVGVYLFDEEAEHLRFEAGTHAAQDSPTTDIISLTTAGLIPLTARSRQMVLVNDIENAEDYRADADLPDTRAEMVLPMMVGDMLIGVLDLQSKQVNRFSIDDQRVLTTLAEQVGIAIQNAHLYAEQIRIADELRALDNMKSQFLASVSHELRTPLNAILNFTQFVKMGMLGTVCDKQTEALSKVLDSGNHLLALINDVLDITKIESGMMKLFVEEGIDLGQEIEAVMDATESLIGGNPVRFIKDIDRDLPSIVGDRRRIRQVLLNLLSNAAKFTEEGTITFSAKHLGDHILFVISDTGPGIDPAEHQVIFEPFEQTETGIQHAGGTGLGLPITKRLVEAHGGELWLESILGEGSTFYAQFPISCPALIDKMHLEEESIA